MARLTEMHRQYPLADLSRSHPVTVGAPGRGDRELTMQHGGPI
jgi:hypothetical protein